MKPRLPPPAPRDDRPEHIHMVVCGVGFFGFYFLLRVFHLGHIPSSVIVVVAALPLMYVLLPISTVIYCAVSKPETRLTSVHVTDAGCSTLMFMLLAFLMIGMLEANKERGQHTQNTATQRGR